MQKNRFITLTLTFFALSLLLFTGCQLESAPAEQSTPQKTPQGDDNSLPDHPLMQKAAVRKAIKEVDARIEAGTMEYGTLDISRANKEIKITPEGPLPIGENETIQLTATAPTGANLYVWQLYLNGKDTGYFDMTMGPTNSTVIKIDKQNYGKGSYEIVCTVYVYRKPPTPRSVVDLNSNVVAVDFTPAPAPAPVEAWSKRYTGVNWFEAMQATKDGGYVAVGMYKSTTTDSTAVMAKFNKTGDVVWSKELGGSKSEGLKKLITTKEGNFIALGSSNSLGDGNGDWILKFNEAGTIIWQKYINSLPGSFDNICETTTGELIIAGSGMYNELCLTKLNSAGNVVWQKAGPRKELSIIVGALCATENGGFIIAASTMSTPNQDYWLLNFTANGDITWQKTYGAAGREFISSIHKTSDSFVFGGDTKSFADKDDSMLIKVDKQGNIIWQKMFDINQNYEGIVSIISNKTGGTLVSVSTTLINLDDKGNLLSSQTYKELFRDIVNMPSGYTSIGYTSLTRFDNEAKCGTYGTDRAVEIVDTNVTVQNTNMTMVNDSRKVSNVAGFYRDFKITAYQTYPQP